MCGIAGSVGDTRPEFVNSLVKSLRHRGPDGDVRWSHNNVQLAATRLAIVDLADTGKQPFRSVSGRYVAVYNGEIYNHEEIRLRYGIEASRCDGVVIPELWDKLGPQSLSLLRGMFAIALYDMETQETWLAVDSLGIKPLYAAECSERLLFASESIPIAQLLPELRTSAATLETFNLWGCLPSDQSGIDGLERLEPGAILQISVEGKVVNRSKVDMSAWQVEPQSWNDVVESFVGSVDAHLMSDVPIGLMLSSGVDSSAIAWAAAESGKVLDCFTLGLPGMQSEVDVARKTAGHFGHTFNALDGTRYLESDLLSFISSVDRPTCDGVNTYLVASAMHREGVKVAISGVGADELLLGYGHHKPVQIPKFLDDPLRRMAQAVLNVGQTSGMFQDLRHVPRADYLMRLFGSMARRGSTHDPVELVRRYRMQSPNRGRVDGFPGPSFAEIAPPSRRVALAEAEWRYYLSPTLLADADVFSMASSVEVRTPFVDVCFVASVLNTADQRAGKAAFVEATGSTRLVELATARKQGFSVPLGLFADVLRQGLSVRDPFDGSGRTDMYSGLPSLRRDLELWKELIWSGWEARLPQRGDG